METVLPPRMEPLESRVLMAAGLPRPDHVVIVVEENHSYGQVLGPAVQPVPVVPNLRSTDPYIRSLARHGASFTNARAETHPSQPNYLALFSGSTQGVTSDATPDEPFTTPNLGGELIAAGLTFAGYSESMPSVGFTGSEADGGLYARKHNPWVDFADVPASANRPFSDFPRPRDFASLPTVSFVVPNQENDMHSGPVRTADDWLRRNIRRYVRWARRHNSLLILTWDEGGGDDNHIATVFAGAHVRRGRYDPPVNHYDILRTVEDLYDLPHAGASADAQPITGVFT
jgi:phosphatidylinositol-3-phosphatase